MGVKTATKAPTNTRAKVVGQHSPLQASQYVPAGLYAHVLALQRSAGNRALTRLLEAESNSKPSAGTVHENIQKPVDIGLRPLRKAHASAAEVKDADVRNRHNLAPEAPALRGIVQRQCACGSHPMAGGECSACDKKKRLGLQTKLQVNAPGDIYEQEADRIAQQVIAMPATAVAGGAPPRIQRFAGHLAGQAAAAPASVGQALASPGRPLEPVLRQDMERRFGYDFSRVRIHSGAAAVRSTGDVNARAYTVGHDIVFDAAGYAPGTPEGRRLLAHELTHVVQQSGAGRMRVDQHREKHGLSPHVGAGQFAPHTLLDRRLPMHKLTHLVPQQGFGQSAQLATSIAGGDRGPEITLSSAAMLQRQKLPAPSDAESSIADTPGERRLTPAEERKRSVISPGGITGTAEPLMISVYNFAIDKTTLKGEHRAVIQEIARVLRISPTKMQVMAFGHTDSSGEPDVNDPISKGRAQAVQKLFQQDSGLTIEIFWFGEDSPVTSNDTVQGRSRNRRVDIYVFPARQAPPVTTDETLEEGGEEGEIPEEQPVRKQDGKTDEKKDKPKDGQEDGPTQEDTSSDDNGADDLDTPNPCSLFPIVCGYLGGKGAKKLFCMWQPEICAIYDWLTEGDDSSDKDEDEDKDPDEDKDEEPEDEKEQKACPLSVSLPDTVYRVPESHWPILKLREPFEMRLTFQQDAPVHSPYCDCNCGEYRQYVRGYVELDYGTGVVKPVSHGLANGKSLHPEIFQEDGEYTPTLGDKLPANQEAYGHRYVTDIARSFTKNNARQFLAQDTPIDRFISPNREDGCTYIGSDHPGIESLHHPNQEAHFHFWFRGGPVDACHGDAEIGKWSEWEVIGDHKPRKPKPAPTAKPGRKRSGPRLYFGPVGAEVPLVYSGGLYRNAFEGLTEKITIRFESQGAIYSSGVEVYIDRVTDTTIFFYSTNTIAINIAPAGHPPIVIQPGTPGSVPKRLLD